ncbi:MAG: hypothetical protein ACTHOI_10630 [Sphingomicrobium sp.]
MKFLTTAIAASLLSVSGAAAAQTASDARCMLVSNAFAKNSKDANQQKLAQAALYFYLGRIGDSTTAAQLKTLLDSEAKAINEKTAGPMMNACVKTFEAKMDLVHNISVEQQQQQKPKQPQGR